MRWNYFNNGIKELLLKKVWYDYLNFIKLNCPNFYTTETFENFVRFVSVMGFNPNNIFITSTPAGFYDMKNHCIDNQKSSTAIKHYVVKSSIIDLSKDTGRLKKDYANLHNCIIVICFQVSQNNCSILKHLELPAEALPLVEQVFLVRFAVIEL